MKKIAVDFAKNAGVIKPMHAVNNGPAYKFASDQRITNLDSYRDAGIPYARNHDASFYHTYGGEHSVDIHAIFRDFDKDPTDPASYDFQLTDEYLRVIELVGTKVFYRLGSRIEHESKKYGTLPPKDFQKWAVICEHIIRHYTEGWANGFHMDIEYWEIWNEPDLDADDAVNKRCWGGTKAQYFEFYHVAATHLKKCFPHLKIGGPALAHDLKWGEEFLAQLKAPLDFFSWHLYSYEPEKLVERTEFVESLLKKYGHAEAENILNEWNYVCGWEGDDWIRSLKTEKSMKGAAFIAGTMCACQHSSLDMLMYYDARPCGMNGMYDTDFPNECLKGYYPFYAFNQLYRMGNSAETTCEGENVFACAAYAENEAAVMFAHYSDNNALPGEDVEVDLSGFAGEKGVEAEIYLLDEEHDLQLVKKEIFCGQSAALILHAPMHSMQLIRLKKI